MPNKTKSQSGFTLLEICLATVAAGLLITVGVLTYQRISNNAARTQSSDTTISDKKPIAIASEEQQKVQTPPPAPEAKPAAPPPVKKSEPAKTTKTYNYISLQLNDAQIGDTSIAFSTSLPGSYSGKCSLTVRHYTSDSKIYKEVSVAGTSCYFELPRSELADGQWKYYINFYGSDGSTKGESSYKTFTL